MYGNVRSIVNKTRNIRILLTNHGLITEMGHITIQPTTDQDVEDTTESDSEAIVKEVRKSIESNIKQIGTNLSADAIGRIKGDIDNGWLDDSVIDCAQNLIHIVSFRT